MACKGSMASFLPDLVVLVSSSSLLHMNLQSFECIYDDIHFLWIFIFLVYSSILANSIIFITPHPIPYHSCLQSKSNCRFSIQTCPTRRPNTSEIKTQLLHSFFSYQLIAFCLTNLPPPNCLFGNLRKSKACSKLAAPLGQFVGTI